MLEILSHVNKRIRGHDSIALPLEALLDLALAPDSAPMVQNFGLVYAEMACDRATPQQRWQAVWPSPLSMLTSVLAAHGVHVCTRQVVVKPQHHWLAIAAGTLNSEANTQLATRCGCYVGHCSARHWARCQLVWS